MKKKKTNSHLVIDSIKIKKLNICIILTGVESIFFEIAQIILSIIKNNVTRQNQTIIIIIYLT